MGLLHVSHRLSGTRERTAHSQGSTHVSFGEELHAGAFSHGNGTGTYVPLASRAEEVTLWIQPQLNWGWSLTLLFTDVK